MPLTAGTLIGSYEVVAAIGAGGMGEVYQARDHKLNRDVAIKVLPDLFNADPERLARFRREAQVLASLNHPNIAHVYGVEQGAVHALVMELVPGPTLAELIQHAGASGLPLADAVPIARQIAEALEAAHEQGVIHRDLKPANVKVRDDGTVKVLDFGLAKALDPMASASGEAMNSPTLTARATQLGVILGTAAYMAPEQAKGKPVDRRADIWAFGAVLYEMLTGQRAFKGEDVSDTLAAVLRQDVDWTALSSATPPALRRLLERCLDRDPKQRLRDIGEARLLLEKLPAHDERAPAVPIVAAPPAKRPILPWLMAGIATVGAAGVVFLWAPWRAPVAPGVTRVSAEIGVDASIDVTVGPGALLSPDGRLVAFLARSGDHSQIYVRRVDQLQAAALGGTEDATAPFFSHDGRWIGFFAGGKLKKISVLGGAAVAICDAPTGRGGSWAEDNTIVFTPNSGSGIALMRVAAAGGTPVALTKLAEGEVTQRWPQILPGGKGVLYTSHNTIVSFEGANVVVQPLPSGAPKVLARGAFYARYLASGHLVYIHDGTLFAVPFDLDRLETRGEPVPAVEGVLSILGTAGAQYSVSDDGTLVYVFGRTADASRPVFWMDQAGVTTPLRAVGTDWYSPRFSPDGQKLAMQIRDATQADIWIYEWARDTLMKFTFDPASDAFPVWTPDGKRIVFSSERAVKGVPNLYWQRADGTGEIQRLTDSPAMQQGFSFHPSGKWLAYAESKPNASWGLALLPIEGDDIKGWTAGKPTTFLDTPALEFAPMFSPDGRWIAYMSNESGRMEVYVRPFPGPGGKWQISTDGGIWPVWSTKKPQLFFATLGRLYVVPFAVQGESFHAEKPQLWSPTRYLQPGQTPVYDLHPDGLRFALSKAPETTTEKRDKVVFVFNFFEELRRATTAK